MGHATTANHAAYAQFVGAPYHCAAFAHYEGHPSWKKMDMLGDWLRRDAEGHALWIDADAVFTSRLHVFQVVGEENISADLCVAADENGINMGVFLIRPTTGARALLDAAMKLRPRYEWHQWAEQRAIMDVLASQPDICRVATVPRAFNAYAQGVAGLHGGDWKPGDLVLHRPGGSVLDKLMALQPHIRDVDQPSPSIELDFSHCADDLL